MFKEKVIVIGGATGVVGSGAVRAFLNEGALVVGISRSQSKIDDLIKSMAIRPDEPFYPVIGDFNTEADAVNTKDAVLAVLNGKAIDHIVSSIGFAAVGNAPTATSLEFATGAFTNGFFNIFLMAKVFVPLLKNQDGSSYTMVSGGLSHGLPPSIPKADALWLGTVKNAAVNSFTYGLNAETFRDKVRVNTICIHFGVAAVGQKTNQLGMPSERDTHSLAPAFLEVAKGTVCGQVICLNSWVDVKKPR